MEMFMINMIKDQIINYLDSKEVDCYQTEFDLFCDHFNLVADDDGCYQYDSKVFDSIDELVVYNDETIQVFAEILNSVYND
jgi:hypothetical protein